MLLGSDDPTKKDFSTVSVGSEILLEGWSGIFIDHLNNTGYGILVNMNGKINAIDDIDGGKGIGIYVNGNIKNKENAPVINLTDTSNITSTGNGIYSAGYATYNINGAYINGKESGIGMKAGIFNILNGTIIGSGEDKTPTNGNNNGINPSGVAIQMESNAGYPGNMELYIKNGNIKSEYSNVIYEYTVNNTTTRVKNIELSGGTYTSNANKDVFLLSESFKDTHQGFITGGTYSSNPISYLKSGYHSTKNTNDNYEVTVTTMNVFKTNNINNNNNFFGIVLIATIIIILGTIIYINRNKILNLIK